MSKAIEAHRFRVWLALSGITLVSYWLGSENAGDSALITYAALLIVAIKVRVIVAEFMEARRASMKLQLAMDAWLFVLLAALTVIYTFRLDMPAV
ncbi:MAG TPA: cytochrome C oxidase subunit IV family protein [Polyangiales bacterium]|nr:cytochrome C oxidase subunit IV family protein [Polyangiales bacterium]